jgi:2-oxoglutarate ferredoxin oxidoreductase subunit gamma
MVDTRPVRGDIEIFEVPANDLAKDLGNGRLTNMVMLGAFLRKTGMASIATTEQAVQEIFEEKGKSIVKQNERALKAGYDYME